MRAMILFLQRVLQSCAAVREWKTNDAAEQSSSQMEYIPGKDGMLHGAEQFLDRIDSWKRWDAAEQSSSWKRHDAAEHCSSWKRQDAAQSRAVPGQNRFLEKTGCCRAEQFLDRKIPGKDGMIQSRAVPGQNRFLAKTGCCRAEQFLEKTGCCRVEQFLDSLDFWKRRDAAEQSSSWIERFLEKTGCCKSEQFLQIEQIPGKDGMLQIRAVPGQNRDLEKTRLLQSRKGVICGRERKTLLLLTKIQAKPFVLCVKM